MTINCLVNLMDLSEISRGEGSVNRSLKRESHEKIGSERVHFFAIFPHLIWLAYLI